MTAWTTLPDLTPGIFPFDGKPVILAVVDAVGRHPPVVGEAYYHRDAHPSNVGWWWANTGPGEYTDDLIINIQHGVPTHYQPMPEFKDSDR